MIKYKINVQKIILSYIIENVMKERFHTWLAIATPNIKYLGKRVIRYVWELHGEKNYKNLLLGKLNIVKMSLFPIINSLAKSEHHFNRVNFGI